MRGDCKRAKSVAVSFARCERGEDPRMRRLLAVVGAAVAAAFVIAAVAVADKGPEQIALPDGYAPEGIAAGKGRSVYVGSIPTGRVLEIDTKTGASREAVPARPDRAAIGLKYDKREGRLFVSGGPFGKAFVYDESSGTEVAAFQLTEAGQPTFINDVVLTRDTAYFTDSRQPVIYAVDRDLSGFTPIELTGFPMTPGVINLNGIEAASNGRVLLAIQSSTGTLWRIDPGTGSHVAVDLGGEMLTNGDGLLLIGPRTLLVVQNRSNRIAVVELDKDFDSGRVVDRIRHPDFDVPTTVARQRGSLYLPNARFGTTSTPDTAAYWITRVGK
jgi:sugar lactone lactonase YvrE